MISPANSHSPLAERSYNFEYEQARIHHGNSCDSQCDSSAVAPGCT
jgi:hypothetical protein